MRIEKDSFGSVELPEHCYYGAQTARALDWFPKVGPRMPPSIIHAFGIQKCAAAKANARLGVLEKDLSELIQKAALELQSGRFDDHFPLPIWQTGSGTQTNMCANEVIANRANELAGHSLGSRYPVHPNDHVNCSQSSNDSFPTVMHIAAVDCLLKILPRVKSFEHMLTKYADDHGHVVRIGRTHLNDAVPVMYKMNVLTWLSGVQMAREQIEWGLNHLYLLSQGGTAAGSGLNAPAQFAELFCAELNALTGREFKPHPVKAAGMASHDALATASSAIKGLALALMRIANDIRHLASGPRAGLGELDLPEDGLSSSIMPGKRNATQAEALVQIAHRIVGNHATVEIANSSSLYELNVAKPVIIQAVIESVELLNSGLVEFEKFVSGVTPKKNKMTENVERSLMLATALTPELGYDVVSEITRKADTNSLSLREAVAQSGMMTMDRYDELVQPKSMATGEFSIEPKK